MRMSIENLAAKRELQNMLIGYARVSTADQNLELQSAALKKAWCRRLFTDKISGVNVDRPGIKEALSHLREGDTLVVWKLDRLGQSVKGLVELAWISTDKHPANAALAQYGYGTAESDGGRYQKGCTDRSIARSLFADGDRPGLCSTCMAGYAKPLFMRVSWRLPRW
jgi:DNA invertase Pin-like site-specific DNA recombinase